MVPGGEIGNADGGNDVPERRGWVCFVLLRKQCQFLLSALNLIFTEDLCETLRAVE